MTQAVAKYWSTNYDWRKIERKLNSYTQSITEIDGLDIHFLHVRSNMKIHIASKLVPLTESSLRVQLWIRPFESIRPQRQFTIFAESISVLFPGDGVYIIVQTFWLEKRPHNQDNLSYDLPETNHSALLRDYAHISTRSLSTAPHVRAYI